MALYEILLLGSPTPEQLNAISDRALDVAQDFSLEIPDDLALRSGSDISARDPKGSSVAIYFAGDPNADITVLDELETANVPIIPVISPGTRVTTSIPTVLQPTNAYILTKLDDDLGPLMTLALECIGLLREQRRVFISYRRVDSREVAVQLHDHLSSCGFDVFLDTHDIRPGEPFQEALWHRLADCDVVVMLDTSQYFESKWTKQKIGRTLSKGIHILRLVWPDHTPSRHLTLSETIRLEPSNFDEHARLDATTLELVEGHTETLRSRSVATRHREIAGKLRVEVERLGGTFEGIGLHRSISIVLPHGTRVCAYTCAARSNGQGRRRALADLRGAGRHTSGGDHKLSPGPTCRVMAEPCFAWTSKMLVTPWMGMQFREWRRTAR